MVKDCLCSQLDKTAQIQNHFYCDSEEIVNTFADLNIFGLQFGLYFFQKGVQKECSKRFTDLVQIFLRIIELISFTIFNIFKTLVFSSVSISV